MMCPVASAGSCMHLQITGVSWSRIDIPFLFPPNVVVCSSRLTNWASCDQSNCKCRPISGAAGCPFINWRHLSCLTRKAFFCGWHWQAHIMHPFWTSTRCTHVTAHLSFLKLPQRCLVLVWFFQCFAILAATKDFQLPGSTAISLYCSDPRWCWEQLQLLAMYHVIPRVSLVEVEQQSARCLRSLLRKHPRSRWRASRHRSLPRKWGGTWYCLCGKTFLESCKVVRQTSLKGSSYL